MNRVALAVKAFNTLRHIKTPLEALFDQEVDEVEQLDSSSLLLGLPVLLPLILHRTSTPILVTPTVSTISALSTAKKSTDFYGMTVKSRRTRANQNLGNVRPSRSGTLFEGQAGIEQTESAGQFAIFTDPYYSVRAAYKSTIASKPATDPFWNIDIAKKWPKAARSAAQKGRYLPHPGRNLYRVIFHYSPFGDGKNDSYLYATKFLSTGAWKTVDDPLDLTIRSQFIAFFKTVFLVEQGTQVSSWYLSRCYDAIFLGATPPLQEVLKDEGAPKGHTLVYDISPGLQQ